MQQQMTGAQGVVALGRTPSQLRHTIGQFQVRTRRKNFASEPDLPLQGVGGVVIGGDFQGLGIARSLGRQGVPVCVIDDEHCIARYSRYVSHRFHVKDLRDEQTTVNTLMSIGRRYNLKGWVLYPTRDETVAALSRHKRTLSKLFRVPTPDWECIKWAWDKRNTYKLAEALGIPCPKTWFPHSLDDVKAIDAKFPLILKPAIKEHFVYTAKVKAWKVNNKTELIERFAKAASFVPPGEMMVQDLIPGGSSEQQFGCGFLFIEGKAVGTMHAQYVRSHPPDFGRCSTCVETTELPELEEMALRFLRAVHFYGLAEVEFRRDPRDGIFKLLDVNARTWGYHSLGSAAGVDFPYMLFQDQLGIQVPTRRARGGTSWVRLVTDFPVGLHSIIRGKSSIWSYLKTVLRCKTEAVFSRDDPLPFIAEAGLIPYLFWKRGF
jgi:D-aspartate ligase